MKRSRDQSAEAPRRLSWLMIVPPLSAFHSRRARGTLRGHLAAWRLYHFGKLALDDHLRRDARMVRARLPQHVLATHTLEADQDVLQRIVERMPDVERTGHVRRRDNDGKGLAPGRALPRP